jgi:hypothetical protein
LDADHADVGHAYGAVAVDGLEHRRVHHADVDRMADALTPRA